MLAFRAMIAPLLGAFLVFAQTATPFGAASRPVECTALDGSRVANVWERAKSPALRRYCDLLASATSKLAGSTGMSNEVLAIADEADKAVPGRAAPSVLRGRAQARLGKYTEAYAALHDAKAKDERALDDPASLLAWARVALRTGHAEEAREAYRQLLPRASALPISDRGPAYVEAGLLAMARGPAGLEEAIAIFRQARRDAQDVEQTVAVLALGLALDRSGERDEARAVIAERVHGDPRGVLSDARARKVVDPATSSAEMDAIAAVALEAWDPALAREAWHRYVEAASSSPWIEHARQREAGLNGKRASKPK
ncbi:MAG: hypothetical protein JWM74_511 [Myxococcaceae bacterium]|nr:hypothetical protein [Myxococcaceae bacterium]